MAQFIRVSGKKAINLDKVAYYAIKENSIVFYLSLDEGDTLTYSVPDLEALKWFLERRSTDISVLYKEATTEK